MLTLSTAILIMDPIKVAFVNRLRKRMSVVGLDQQGLAQEIGVSKVTVSRWVNNDKFPSESNIIRISEALECDPHWLKYGRERVACVDEGCFRPISLKVKLEYALLTLDMLFGDGTLDEVLTELACYSVKDQIERLTEASAISCMRKVVCFLQQTRSSDIGDAELFLFGQDMEEGLRSGNWLDIIARVEMKKSFTKRRRVPLLSWSEVGVKAAKGSVKLIYSSELVSKRGFAMTIKGDSMEPAFTFGEIIIVDPDILPETGKYVVVKMAAGGTEFREEAVLKQFFQDGDRIFLKALNPIYGTVEVTHEEFEILGSVISKQNSC